MLILASFDRYCSSSKSQGLNVISNKRIAQLRIVISIVTATIYMSPMTFIFYFDTTTSTCRQYSNLPVNIYVLSQVVIYYMLGPLLLVVLGVLTIINIRRHGSVRVAPRNPRLSGRRTEGQLVRMLLLQVCCHLILTTPFGVVYSLNAFNPSTRTPNIVECTRIGIIYNVSLVGQTVSQMNVTSCDECLCRLAKNITFISFNCHLLSRSCEMFGAYNDTISYQLISNINSSFSFIQLPPSSSITTAVTTPIKTTTTTTTGPCSYTVAGQCNSTSGSDRFSLKQPIDIYLTRNDSILYVADFGNTRIQQFQLSSKNGTTVPVSIPNVGGLYYDDYASILYIAQTSYDIVFRWPLNKTLPLAGAAKACNATGGWFGGPYGIVGDAQGNIYVAHSTCNTVVKWAANATTPILIGGLGVTGNTSRHLNFPRHMYLDEKNSYIYVADSNNHRIQRFSTNGNGNRTGVTVAGGNGAGSGANQLNTPAGVFVSQKDGSVYVSDRTNHRIQKWLTNATSGVTVVGNMNGTSGNTTFTLNQPYTVVLDQNETYMYIADFSNNRIQRYPVV
ncbi:unnamed protein product [Adineta ricciae]|uniref:G-protein coupled receptors family 1 profile domain-containing protein n=1 Tax=Adineta ricciae TaxID=249248 RepID=A0A815EMI8_ADIRI|nr:unnamed protein product [Adineta ricciae]